jgi:hypothetical protein
VSKRYCNHNWVAHNDRKTINDEMSKEALK